MKIRSLSLLIFVFTIILSLTSTSVFAGRRHHERWKGIAIGLGVAILGNAIINSRDCSVREYEQCTAVVPASPRHYSPYQGHWEIRDEWVPPIYRNVWNPAHYNRRGDWVEGAWTRIEDRPGYWRQKKVWITPEVSSY